MLKIKCPFCGHRNESEFSCGGEAHIARPSAAVSDKLTDSTFSEYLFMRENPKGVFLERWCHTSGCRRWFNVARDTVTHQIYEIYPAGKTPKTTIGKKAYQVNWRRKSKAEVASKYLKRTPK